MKNFFLFLFFASLIANLSAEIPAFKSELFEKGTLIYSDDFDGEFNRERWGAPSRDKQIKDGELIFTPKFSNAEEAMKVLGRDHHLGLDPTAHLNKIPEKFVCHLRYKFESEALAPNRPVLQIGHHMIALFYIEGGGHSVKLPQGPSYAEPGSGMALDEWVDLVIEYQEGTILIGVNGYDKTYEHDRVTIVNSKDKSRHRFSFKHGIPGPKSRIVFDSVRLWEVD